MDSDPPIRVTTSCTYSVHDLIVRLSGSSHELPLKRGGNFFMNRKMGFIRYNDELEIYSSLTVFLSSIPMILRQRAQYRAIWIEGRFF